jgi:DNA-binding FadR family transcriptional regulator
VSEPDDSAERTGAHLYSAVAHTRMSKAIVDQVRQLIREERLRPGDRLPSERVLGERMGVSRVTVREALRVLEAGGFVEIRVGARGGAVVRSPSSHVLGSGLADLLSQSALHAAEVVEARQVFEVGIIPLVIERATCEDIDALRSTLAAHRGALNRSEYGLGMSAMFHLRVAACTHNAAIEMLAHLFHDPLLMALRRAQVLAPRMGRRGTAEHLDFVEAIAQRDADRAGDIMRVHLRRTAVRIARLDQVQQPGPRT